MRDYNYFQKFHNKKERFFLDKKIPQIPIYLVLQFFVLFCLIFLLIFQNIRYKDLEKTIYEQIKLNRKLDEKILPLQLEVRSLTRNEILEKLAEEKFYLYPPTKEQLIDIDYAE